MSSVGELPQIIAALQEIDSMIGKVQVKTETLKVETSHTKGSLNELEYVFYRVTSIMGRMGLPKEMDKAIMTLQRVILVARMVQHAMTYLYAASWAHPIGWALGALNLMGAALIVSPPVEAASH